MRKKKEAKVAELKEMSNTNQLDYSLYEGTPSDYDHHNGSNGQQDKGLFTAEHVQSLLEQQKAQL